MKLRSLLAALLFATATSFAHEPVKPETRKIQLPVFDHLTINAKIDVVLIDDGEPGTIYLVGDPRLFKGLSFRTKENELQITGRNEVNYKSRVTIEVHVKNLAKISLQHEALVFSGNTLRSKKINVFIREGSKASLVSTGDINISSEEDTELVFLRKIPGVSVANR